MTMANRHISGISLLCLAALAVLGAASAAPQTGPKQKGVWTDPEDKTLPEDFKIEDGQTFELKKSIRKSPTLGQKPADGAEVLFDGTSADAFTRGRVERGILHTDAKDILTKRRYNNYTIHLEFMLPFKPAARG